MTQQDRFGFLFPGQGAQFPGMGKDLFEQFASARKVFEAADKILGYSISDVCFNGSEEKITRTLYAQPAIFVTSFAALTVLREKFPDLKPAFAAGLSLGEFTALTAAGSLTFEEGLKLVAARAQAMEKAAEKNIGTMASVMGLPEKQCEEVAQEAGCQMANLNTPEQFVLSGTVESVQKACQIAEQKGAKRAIVLKVGGAFHSSLMTPAKEDLEKALAKVTIANPSCVFIPNATAKPPKSTEEIRELLAKQLTSPVRWIETMQKALESGVQRYLEIGPGKVLKGLARKCQPSLEVLPCGTVSDLQAIEQELHSQA